MNRLIESSYLTPSAPLSKYPDVTSVRYFCTAVAMFASLKVTLPAYRSCSQFLFLPRMSALTMPTSGMPAANGSAPPSSIGVIPAALSLAQASRNSAQFFGAAATPALVNRLLR